MGSNGPLTVKPSTLRLILALFISQVGDWIAYVALPLVVYQHTGSPLMTSISLLVELVPALVFAPVAGVIVDRFSRWAIMVMSDLTRGALLLVMAVSGNVTLLIGAAFMVGAVSQFFSPAVQASIPDLEPQSRLVRVNSIREALSSIAMIAGPALGGLVVGLSGPGTAFVADALSFFLSACLICTVRMPRSYQLHRAPRSVLREAVHGLKWLARNSSLSGTVLLMAAVLLGAGALNALEPVYATQVSRSSQLAFGMMVGAWGLGMFLGAVCISASANRIRLRTTFLWGTTLLSMSVGGAAVWPILPVVLGFLVVGGVGNSVTAILLVSILQRSVPDHMRGRVFAFSHMFLLSTQVSAILLWGWLAQYFSVRVLLAAAGCVATGATVLGWFRWTYADTSTQWEGEDLDPA